MATSLNVMNLTTPKPNTPVNKYNVFITRSRTFYNDGDAQPPPGVLTDKWWMTPDELEPGCHKLARFVPGRDIADLVSLQPDEIEVWRGLNSHFVVIVSGPAGSGKSHLLRRLIAHAEEGKLRFEKTATTGRAAEGINGSTLHSAVGLGLAKETIDKLITKMHSRSGARARGFFQGTDLLFIDEVSMLDVDFFSKIDHLARHARKQPNLPFGGMALVLVGDFTQLPPVKASKMLFECQAFQSLRLCRVVLLRNYRQEEGSSWLDALNALRIGKLTQAQLNYINERVCANSIEAMEEACAGSATIPVCLYPTRADAESRNLLKLQDLAQRTGQSIRVFPPHFALTARKKHGMKPQSMKESDIKQAEALKKNEEKLKAQFQIFNVNLILGAQVMMKRNTFQMSGIVNGSVGTVQALDTNRIDVLFENGVSIGIPREEFYMPVGDSVALIMNQFPLLLGWAYTVHAAQGITLDRGCILPNFFCDAQAYVALSRVRTHAGVYMLAPLRAQAVMTHSAAVDFEHITTLKAPPSPTVASTSPLPPTAAQNSPLSPTAAQNGLPSPTAETNTPSTPVTPPTSPCAKRQKVT